MSPRGFVIVTFNVTIAFAVFDDNPHSCGEWVKAVECQKEEETVSFAVSLVLL